MFSVALKCIEGVFNTVIDAKRTLREVSILRQCNHMNLVRCRAVLMPSDPAGFTHLWVVLDLCKWDLGKVIRLARNFKGWSEQHVKFILYQMLCGVNYLHSANVVHRDLKPSNLLVTEKCEVRVCDYGLSREIKPKGPLFRTASAVARGDLSGAPAPLQTQLTKHVVTRWYRAPELILLEKDYTAAIDVWSCGCIFAEMLQTLEPLREGVPPPSRTLFPGDSCYPLSNTSNEEDVDYDMMMEELEDERHQLNSIFKIIGTPSEEELASIVSAKLRKAIEAHIQKVPVEAQSFRERYPSADGEAINLLQGMLCFDPSKRVTVHEALGSAYLKNAFQPPGESKPVADPSAAALAASDEHFDFSFDYAEQTPQSLREMMLQEIAHWT